MEDHEPRTSNPQVLMTLLLIIAAELRHDGYWVQVVNLNGEG